MNATAIAPVGANALLGDLLGGLVRWIDHWRHDGWLEPVGVLLVGAQEVGHA